MEQERMIKMCEDLLDYGDDHESFDPSFAVDIYDKLKEGKLLTPRQRDALENVYEQYIMK